MRPCGGAKQIRTPPGVTLLRAIYDDEWIPAGHDHGRKLSCRDWIEPTKARTKRHEQSLVSDFFFWSCPKRISSHRACGSVGKRRVELITLGASPRGCADRDAAAGDGHKVINARRAPVPSGTCPHIHRLPWPTHGRALQPTQSQFAPPRLMNRVVTTLACRRGRRLG